MLWILKFLVEIEKKTVLLLRQQAPGIGTCQRHRNRKLITRYQLAKQKTKNFDK